MSYRLTPQASQDLIDIADFLLIEYPSVAPDVERSFLHLFGLITEFPGIGRRGPRPGTRELTVRKYPYVIIFRPNGRYIDILRIYHTARDPKGKL